MISTIVFCVIVLEMLKYTKTKKKKIENLRGPQFRFISYLAIEDVS